MTERKRTERTIANKARRAARILKGFRTDVPSERVRRQIWMLDKRASVEAAGGRWHDYTPTGTVR